MAQFSQNASEQIMKSDRLGSGLPWRLLTFSAFIFLLVILSYLGLSVGYTNYLNSQISDRELQIADLTKNVSPEVQSVFANFYSRLSNFKNLLSSHIYTDKLFPLLEKITNPSVYYTNLDLDISQNQLVLSGLASNFDALSRQLFLYDQEPMVSAYILNQSRLVEGFVNFRVTLILSPKIFAK